MKRASLVAPLLLIAAGALFLARNLYPELPLYDYIARFWPYVLILWGTLRVVEILYWANTSKPLPARGISGGEWALIVLLCLVGTGMHSVRTFVWQWPERIPWSGVHVIGERFDYPVSVEKAASKTARVEIEDFRGDVQITGSDVDEVKVTGRKSVRALDKDQADRADRNSSVEVTGDPGEIRVRLRAPSGFGPQVSAALEIEVPKGASVEAKRRDGDVRIGNVAGAVAVSGRAVNLDVHEVSGPVTIEGAYTGEVALKNLAKTVRFKSQRTEFSAAAVPGEIHLDAANLSADGLTGPAELHSRSRDVKLRDFREPLEIDLERGDLHLEPVRVPLARIEAKVRAGNAAIVLPEAAAFSIRATTKNGEITNGLGPGFRVNSDGRSETLEGTSGSGPRIVVESERGSIAVSRGSAVKDTAQPLETINQ